jgi:hypothetical protein
MVAALLGAALVLGVPVAAHADQGKWWKPKQKSERTVVRHDRYRAPEWRAPRQAAHSTRYARAWRGHRIYRDQVWVGRGWGYSRPVYGWRYYVAPTYYYPRRIVYVRPIRFFVSAGAVIGGVRINAAYADRGDIHGCNFCDARFHSFHAYETHVERCPHGPDGYRVVAQEWDTDSWSRDDGHWSRDDG